MIHRGPKEKWKCAICEHKILPPGNMALHYDKEHSNFLFGATSRRGGKRLPLDVNIDNLIQKSLIKQPSRQRRGPKQPKPTPNFWPCSICGEVYLQEFETIEIIKFKLVLQATAFQTMIAIKSIS